MTRVAIYVRQSEDVSEGIARQIARCRLLAEAKGWTVVKEYVDNDVSAAKERGAGTAWAAMLGDLAVHSADVVVAVDLDRLLRNTRDLAALIDTGARVLTVNGEIDLTTADGEFRATMLAGIARFEVRRKSERQVRANLDRATNGRPNPGRRRYGYETDGRTPRAVEADVVRRMFEHVATGGSIRSIARDLTAEAVDPAPGKEWSSRRVRDILVNPHYSGSFRHLGEIIPSELINPIVDPALAERVLTILSDPSRTTTPGPKVRHLLSNIASCNVCGARMVYMRSYRCTVSSAHTSILKPLLESRVRDEIANAFVTGGPSLFPASAEGTRFATRVAEHERNTAAVSALIADRDEGLVPAAVARLRLLELKAAREAIEADLDHLRTERSAAGAVLEIAQGLLVAAQTGDDVDTMKATILAQFDALDMERQREIVRALVHVEVAPGRSPSRVIVEHKLALHLNPDPMSTRPVPAVRLLPRAVRERLA